MSRAPAGKLHSVSRSDALLEAQRHVLEMIVRGRPLPEVLSALCSIVEAQAERAVRAAILLVDADGKRLFTGAAPSLPEEYNRAVDGIAIAPDVGTCCAAAALGKVVVTREIATDPGWALLKHLPLGLGLQAAWSMPIVSSDSKVLGTFGTYFPEVREPLPLERRLVEVLVRTAALAIERQLSDHSLRAGAARDHALAQSRARLDYAVRLSGVGFWSCDLPFDELVWDDNVKDHFFLPHDARVTIDTFYDRLHPDDRAATRQAVEASIRERATYDVVYRTLDPGFGALKWIRALGGATYAADGTPSHFDGVTVDVTSQRLDQERLARALEREREQARVLKQVAAAALTIHASSSLGSVLQAVTAEARTIIGAHRATATLNGAEAPLSVHSESGPGDASTARHRSQLTVVLKGHEGEQLGVVELADKYDGDFTETDEAILVQLAHIAAVAIENARLYDQLRDQDRRKDEFLATLAHELRNPLAPIRTGLHILRMNADVEQGEKTREMMERQLGHLVRMVDDLLDVSRITLGKVTLKKSRVDFRSVLHSAVETTRPLIEAGGHEFAVRVAQGPLPLDVDPTRLAQVLANLVNNAAKYTPAGGRIQLGAEVDGAMLVVRVSDTGVGIPSEMLPEVFDMFTQVGRSIDRSQGGLGIGLTLVRRLVEMHGGSVEAESAGADAGSTFTLRLPLAPELAEPSRPVNHELPTNGSALRILVVDDNVDGAETLAMLLELQGHVTRLAHSGTDALAAAGEFHPQVVFLDIGLPGLNGYQVARKLRADPLLVQPVLVALTGWGSDEDRKQAHAAGFDRHMVKPVDTDKLAELLSTAVGVS